MNSQLFSKDFAKILNTFLCFVDQEKNIYFIKALLNGSY